MGGGCIPTSMRQPPPMGQGRRGLPPYEGGSHNALGHLGGWAGLPGLLYGAAPLSPPPTPRSEEPVSGCWGGLGVL